MTDKHETLAERLRKAETFCGPLSDVNHLFGEAADALAALPPAGVEEWQPIESAPKDGTRLLLATEIGVVIGSWGMGRYLGKTKGYEKAWGRGSSYGWHPTHWQPLPAPPTPTTEQGSTEPTNGDEG